MALPTLQRTWLFSTNNRINFVSLNDTTSRVLFAIKNFLVATLGYAVKYTCDGTTGPTSANDHTDRWLSPASCTTRGAGTANPQSFAVLTDSNTAVGATGVLTGTANFSNGETVTTGSKTYTFQTVLTNVDGNVLIGASLAATLANLANAINLGAGAGTTYAAATTANTFVSATAGATTVTLTALTFGPTGNTIATTETIANASFANATLTGGSGVDILLTYQGATDDFFKLSMSVGALFTPAGTATNQPTATDETIIMPNTTLGVGSATSGDRILHLMGSTDKKGFRAFIYRANTLVNWLGIESVNSTVTGVSWPSATVGWATANATLNSATNGHVLITSTTVGGGNGGGTRIGSTNLAAHGGGVSFANSAALNGVFSSSNTELNAASPLTPLGLYSNLATLQGKLGDRVDMYAPWAVSISQGNVFGASQWVLFGTAIHPWNGGPVILS